MNTNRGIFETFPEQAGGPENSPFKPADETKAATGGGNPPSPFSTMQDTGSPFAKVIGDPSRQEPGKSAKLPERRKPESPFQMADESADFGFDAPAPGTQPSPFTPASQAFPATHPPAKNVPDSPFAIEKPAPVPAANPFPQWEPAPQPLPQSAVAAARVESAAPAPQPAAQPSDSSSITQLELRAIFGVDRELSADEILQRARSLPGIRGVVRVGPSETTAIESLKNLVPMLGLSGPLKLYAGNSFVEFVREGPVLLAVQTDRGFAPGVRETLIIVARELGRLS